MTNSAQTAPRPGVIRTDPLAGRSDLRDLLRIVPAWLISAGLHAVLFLLFFLVLGDPRARANQDAEDSETVSTQVDAGEQSDPVLTVHDEGIDPLRQAGFDINRIDADNIPGPVDPSAAAGLTGFEGPPVAYPLPPGSGDGAGGGAEAGEMSGSAMPGRDVGGDRGDRNTIRGFDGRPSGATRERTALAGGGSKASEAAVARGLRWLALHQAPEGHWSLDQYNLHARTEVNSNRFINDGSQGKGQKNDSAGAAFGLLPFLAAGITHKPTGRPQDDQYVKTVKRALEYLIARQGKDGAFPGGMYAHGLCSIAMCEAYGLTADPMLKRPAQAAINYIVQAQDPAGGGWRYSPRSGGDTSVVGWQFMALKSGQMAGLNVPRSTIEMAAKYLDSVESTDGGGFGYTGPGDSPTMSAVGLLCRQYLGAQRRNPNLRNGVEKLKRYPPSGQRNIYYEYYATQVMHHMGGDYWDFWNKGDKGNNGMRESLIARQDRDGSWNPQGDAHSGAGGRIMQTSLSLLTLEVYYRHLPLYQRVDTKK